MAHTFFRRLGTCRKRLRSFSSTRRTVNATCARRNFHSHSTKRVRMKCASRAATSCTAIPIAITRLIAWVGMAATTRTVSTSTTSARSLASITCHRRRIRHSKRTTSSSVRSALGRSTSIRSQWWFRTTIPISTLMKCCTTSKETTKRGAASKLVRCHCIHKASRTGRILAPLKRRSV